jgi:hypothetical protein
MLSEMWRTPTSYHYNFMLKNVENFKPSSMKTYNVCRFFYLIHDMQIYTEEPLQINIK